jgi:glyoxylase-like metal-dependent hydrolase (beta-lactamase superfamily II)
VLSHLHFDHAGGLLAAWEEGKAAGAAVSECEVPRRPRVLGAGLPIRIRATRASFIPELQPLLQTSGRLEIVENEHSSTLGKSVRFSYSDGHTPGLMLAEIDSGSAAGVAFCADLIPGRPWVHLPVTMGYDRAPELLIDEKRAFLEDKLARGVRLFFTHDSGCALAGVVRDAKGKFGTIDELAELAGVTV